MSTASAMPGNGMALAIAPSDLTRRDRTPGISPRLVTAPYSHQINGERLGPRRWKCNEFVAIELLVGERDKTFASAPVMPSEHSDLPEGFLTCFEDRFIIYVFKILVVTGSCLNLVAPRKEVGWRKLLLIADNNHLLRPQKPRNGTAYTALAPS